MACRKYMCLLLAAFILPFDVLAKRIKARSSLTSSLHASESVANKSSWQIFVKVMNSPPFAFDCDAHTTVEDLEDEILTRHHISALVPGQPGKRIYEFYKGSRRIYNAAPDATLHSLGISQGQSVNADSRGLLGGAAGGLAVTHDEWQQRYDFSVSIRSRSPCKANPNQMCTSQCTGTILGNKVLTAAHCIVNKHGVAKAPSRDWRVIASDRVVRHVIHAVYHDDYDPVNGDETDDVGILTLNSAYTNLSPVLLDGSTPPRVGNGVLLAGFGDDGEGNLGDLNVVRANKMKVRSCGGSWGPPIACISSGLGNKASSCGGDSGGGWYTYHMVTPAGEMGCSRAQGAAVIAVVVGVNSFGYQADCGEAAKKTGMVQTSDRYIKQFIQREAPEFTFTSVAGCAGTAPSKGGKDGEGAWWYLDNLIGWWTG